MSRPEPIRIPRALPGILAPRTNESGHRQATWLELFFDLAFVIAIAAMTHHFAHHVDLKATVIYVMTFLPVWWVWNQFTWYASHFDNDDVKFRLLYLLAVGGSLCLAAGSERLAESPALFVGSYLFLHALLLTGWLRAYYHSPVYRPYIALKSSGIGLGLVIWSASLFASGSLQVGLWIAGALAQLLMPVLALRSVRHVLSVHQHHLFERHGLFTIIVLGESLVATTGLISQASSASDVLAVALIFLIAAGLWWTYFDWEFSPLELSSLAKAFAFNYGQFAVYVSLGLLAAGISGFTAAEPARTALISVGSGAYLLSLAGMNYWSDLDRQRRRLARRTALGLILLALSAASAWLPSLAVLALSACLLTGNIALETLERRRPVATTGSK